MNFTNQALSLSHYRQICRNLYKYLHENYPVPYLTQEVNFYQLSFQIQEGVFIPQRDTEILIEKALEISGEYWPSKQKLRVLDIGTGCGNIALSLAKTIDINKKACQVAKNNAKYHQLHNIKFLTSDLFTKLNPDRKFDIIISNPPYISQPEYEKLSLLVKKQPLEALLAEENGTIFYRQICQTAANFLSPKFLLTMEISLAKKRFGSSVVGINEIVKQIREKTDLKEAEVKEAIVNFLEVVQKNLNKGESISFKNYFTLQRQKTTPNISKYCVKHESPIESYRQKNKGEVTYDDNDKKKYTVIVKGGQDITFKEDKDNADTDDKGFFSDGIKFTELDASHKIKGEAKIASLQKEEEFPSFLRSNQNKIVLVKFFTVWCGPCQQLQKTLQKLLSERNDLVILEVDAEKFPYLASEFQVSSVPTLVLFKQGKKIKKGAGNMSIQQLKEFLNSDPALGTKLGWFCSVLVNTPPCHGGDSEFDSHLADNKTILKGEIKPNLEIKIFDKNNNEVQEHRYIPTDGKVFSDKIGNGIKNDIEGTDIQFTITTQENKGGIIEIDFYKKNDTNTSPLHFGNGQIDFKPKYYPVKEIIFENMITVSESKQEKKVKEQLDIF
ncbi:3324_t:CDS:10 [Entrophospora sp. SA101]|nr:3324_t:CDS:10 [Entrophospora sp. SA101]